MADYSLVYNPTMTPRQTQMPRTALFIAYAFPPVGGAGVQRVTKFVKYLPEHGWRVTVLTVENPSVPVFDHSLQAEIPAEVQVLTAGTYEPSYKFKGAVSASSESSDSGSSLRARLKSLVRTVANTLLQPDPQVLWLPRAIRVANDFLKQSEIDIIFATAPPFSSLLLGAYLSRRHGIPLVLDFRDEWDISNSAWENRTSARFVTGVQKRMQMYAIRRASALVATTRRSIDELALKTEGFSSRPRLKCIYNGYDARDFPVVRTQSIKPRSVYRICYVGTLWNLTSVQPLVRALLLLSHENPLVTASIEFVIAGRRTAQQDLILDELAVTNVRLVRLNYLDHAAAIELMLDSDLLCLLLSDLKSAARVVPAKLFEYLACNRSLLAIAPKGEVWELLHSHPSAVTVEPSATDEIKQYILHQVEHFAGGATRQIAFDASQFERKKLTADLAELFDALIDQPAGSDKS